MELRCALQGERLCLVLVEDATSFCQAYREGTTVFIECWSAWDGKIASLSALRVPWTTYMALFERGDLIGVAHRRSPQG